MYCYGCYVLHTASHKPATSAWSKALFPFVSFGKATGTMAHFSFNIHCPSLLQRSNASLQLLVLWQQLNEGKQGLCIIASRWLLGTDMESAGTSQKTNKTSKTPKCWEGLSTEFWQLAVGGGVGATDGLGFARLRMFKPL